MAIKSGRVLVIIGMLALAGCGAPHSSKNGADAAQAIGNPAPSDTALLASAEPFENLTEQAAQVSPDKLKALISAAREAVDGVYPSLEAPVQVQLKQTLTAIDAASGTDDRTGIALAAVEGYRTLIESMSDNGPIPRNVSLLDYAGFRFQADMAASPVRWDDAAQALDFADQQWATLRDTVADTALRDTFGHSLDAMRAAADAQDVNEARKAAGQELDLVDKLEEHFTSKAGK